MKKLITQILPVLFIATQTIDKAVAEEGIIPKLIEYDVEVIIFEDANARYINSEYWDKDSEAITDTTEPPENLDKLKLDEANTTSFKSIKPAILNQEYNRVNNSKEYNVLFYGSWRQTGLDDKKAFDISIEELKNNHKPSSENTISGSFKLVLARYLHIYGDMEYQRKLADTAAVTENEPLQPEINNSLEDSEENVKLENASYPINIHRRMRSKELHYIDHPLVGMLIQINPVKVSTEETAEKPAVQ